MTEYLAASTFSGCGGSCLGYKQAGFRLAYAAEFVDAAADTYAANFPETYLDRRDVREIKGQEILDAIGVDKGKVDLLDGSPPCSAFSVAGKRERGWGKVSAYSDTSQRVDDLFFEFVRLIDEVQPRTFVAENVAGLTMGTAKGYFLRIRQAMRDAGYDVEAKILDAQFLGVPQARRRCIFVGVRNDLGLKPAFPPVDKNVRTLASCLREGEASEPDASMHSYAVGREWRRMGRPGTQSTKYFQLVRPRLDRPCPTITQTGSNTGAASVAHPTECRKFSIAELKRISGFPDDFVLTGTWSEKYERLGRCVPPPMSKAIGKIIRTRILEQSDG